jgi:hypothetical protein
VVKPPRITTERNIVPAVAAYSFLAQVDGESARAAEPYRWGSPDRSPDLRCVPQPLDTPGYSGRRNCNMNLDDSRWDRPGLDGEPKQTRGIPRNLQLDETMAAAAVTGGRG